MSTNNICFCKEVDKSTLVVISLKTTKLLDCALIGACVVIRANTVLLSEPQIILGASGYQNLINWVKS